METTKKDTNESKEDMIRRLDKELDDFIQEKVEQAAEKRAEETEKPDYDAMIKELENHPAFINDFDPSKPLSPEMEGLMRLKYEEQDPTARAEAYKDEGNHEFKKKQYDIAVENYTEGIKSNCPDKELNAILYSNRAAAQFHRGNYHSSLRDCVMARKFKGDHLKAILRGAQCCMEMKKYKDAGLWCDSGLLIEPKNEKFLEIKTMSDRLHRSQERDKRKEEMKERKENEEELKILKTIQSRGIKVAGIKQSDKEKKLNPLLLTNLEVHNPSGAKVHVDVSGILHWPVLLLYPEHTQSDYIEDFNEQHSFSDHINHMFGPTVEPPMWDEDRKYKPSSIKVYFEDKEKDTLYNVSQDSTLLKALQHKRYTVEVGTPCFMLMVDHSPFHEHFLKRYSNVVTVK